MKVLVTGASGRLGRPLVGALKCNGFTVTTYQHTDSLSCVDWDSVDTVVNCAAVTPARGVARKDYFTGNVEFLQHLISHCAGKAFVHFSTLSELYRHEDYQLSKMLANSLLLANEHLFSTLSILPLPTLEDEILIDHIVAAAEHGDEPVVDDLTYCAMSLDAVAQHVVEGLLASRIKPISEFYVEKNLYDEVCRFVPAESIRRGATIQRGRASTGIYPVSSNLLTFFFTR